MSRSRLETLDRSHATDSPFAATDLNVEIAAAFALRMARSALKRAPKWADPDAFEEAALLAVLSARDRYDPKNPTRATFFTYCFAKVSGALREEDRKSRRRPPDATLEATVNEVCWEIPYDEERETWRQVPIIELISRRDQKLVDGIDQETFIRDLFERVCPLALGTDAAGVRAREILLLRYVRGVQQKDVAPMYGVTPGRIHQIEDESISKLKVFLAREQRSV